MKLKTIGSEQKDVTVKKEIFEAEVNQPLLAQAVRVYQANARQATSKTKTRSEINRTHKKWFKQKGTGNARHGARNPNIFVGGGVAHGPSGEQNYSLKLTSKMKSKALISALSWQKDFILVGDQINDLDGKTKTAVKLLSEQLKNDGRILVVVEKVEPKMRQSLNNLEQVLTVSATRLNTLQVLNADTIIMTSQALGVLETRLLGEGK